MAERTGVAIVTGAGSGIGKATALALLGAGWRVALAGRRLDPLRQAVEQFEASEATQALAPARTRETLEADETHPAREPRAIAVVADVSDAAAVEALFERTASTFGRVDLLFNNAGIGMPATPIEDIDIAAFERVVQTNLTGMFVCIRQAFRTMKAQVPQGGRIINNGSIAAYAPRPNSIAYTATKHAVTGLTKQASLDGRRLDIAVGQIDIGNATTELSARMAQGVAQPDGSIRPEAMMDVEIAARSVLYMASLPIEANVLFHTVMATKMPFVGRG